MPLLGLILLFCVLFHFMGGWAFVLLLALFLL